MGGAHRMEPGRWNAYRHPALIEGVSMHLGVEGSTWGGDS